MPPKQVVSPAQDRALLWLHVHGGDAFGTWTNEHEHLRPRGGGNLSVATLAKLETLGLVERATVRGEGWGLYILLPEGAARVQAMIAKGALVPPDATT